MKIAFLDCFSGICGNMLLGALLDAGVPLSWLEQELGKLQQHGFRFQVEQVTRQGIAATHCRVEMDETVHVAHLPHILELIEGAGFSASVRERATRTFRLLAEAEAAVHKSDIEHIHFHEVGTLDAIVDVVGTVLGLDYLGIETLYASAVQVGSGFVECRHGILPLPAPATMQLLKGIPFYSRGVEGELVTPTGAALLAGLVDSFGPLPAMRSTAVAYGAGDRDYQHPNLLRLLLGEAVSGEQPADEVFLLETALDDMHPELLGWVAEKLLPLGALDFYFTPIYMKKNRPATLLSVLVTAETLNTMTDFLLRETSTLGVRYTPWQRRTLQRSTRTVSTPWGPVLVKLGSNDEGIRNCAPEYESCRSCAQAAGVPLKTVYRAALCAASQIIGYPEEKQSRDASPSGGT